MEQKIRLIYDDSFEGILTCLYYHAKKNVAGITHDSTQKNLFDNYFFIKANIDKAQRMYSFLNKRYGKEFVRDIYYCQLSNDTYKGLAILKYFDLAKILGKSVVNAFSHPLANPLKALVHKVSMEKHRFHGLIRFSNYASFLLAKYEPDHNITELIMPHFSDRLKEEHFVIYDISRSLAGVYNTKNWHIKNETNINFNVLSNNDDFEILWREYFQSASINDRHNKKVQKQYMPRRYWKHLTEFEHLK